MRSALMLSITLFVSSLSTAVGEAVDAVAIIDVMKTKLNMKVDERTLTDLKRYFSMSVEEIERKEASGDFSADLGLPELLTLGLGSKNESQELRELKQLFQNNDQRLFQHSAIIEIQLEYVPKEAWPVIMEIFKHDGVLCYFTDPNPLERSLTLRYRQGRSTDPLKARLHSVSLSKGVHMLEPVVLKKGLKIATGSSVGQVIRREENVGCSLVFNFNIEGVPAVNVNWPPAIPSHRFCNC